MKNKNLKAGLILSVVGFAIATAIMLIAIFAIDLIMQVFSGLTTALTNGEVDKDVILELVRTELIIIFVIIEIFNVLALIFAGKELAKSKNRTPKEFQQSKGLSITVFVFDVIAALFFICSFSIESIALALLFVLGAIFTMIGICKNKTLIQQDEYIEVKPIDTHSNQ